MNWTLVALGLGLVCSMCAYAVAVKGFFRTFKLLTDEKDNLESAAAPVKPSILKKIGDSLKSAVLSLIIATAILYFTVVGATIYVYVTANANQDALCALRSDLELRTQSGERFLKEHPKGIPGVPVKTIEEGLHNQKRSIKALSGLSCN